MPLTEARSSAAYSQQRQNFNWIDQAILKFPVATTKIPQVGPDIEFVPKPPQEKINSVTELGSVDAEKKGDSIYDSVDTLNHAKLYNRLSTLSDSDRRDFFESELVGFAGEFAGHIRVKRLTGFLRDDGELELYGFPVLPMYKRTAELAGPNSREQQEWVGMKKMHDAFVAHANREPGGFSAADWVSSSKGAEYGMIFAQRLGKRVDKGHLFIEYILDYKEEKYGITESAKKYNAITQALGMPMNNANSFVSYSDFLQRPILYNTSNADNVDHLYRILNITERDIQKSHLFQIAVKTELQPFISEYYRTMKLWANTIELEGENSPRSREYKELADVIMGAFYNAARDIRDRIDQTDKLSEYKPVFIFSFNQRDDVSDPSFIAMSQQLASSRSLKSERGSNCPTAKKASTGELPSTNDIMASLAEGSNTLSKILSNTNGFDADKNDYLNDPNLCRCSKGGGPHFHCPGEKEVTTKQAKDTLFVIGFSNPKEGSKKIKEPTVVVEKHSCKAVIEVGKGISKCASCGTAATCA